MLFVKFGACNRMCSIGWDLETFDHVYSNVTCIRTDDSHFKNDHHQSTPSQKKRRREKKLHHTHCKFASVISTVVRSISVLLELAMLHQFQNNITQSKSTNRIDRHKTSNPKNIQARKKETKSNSETSTTKANNLKTNENRFKLWWN